MPIPPLVLMAILQGFPPQTIDLRHDGEAGAALGPGSRLDVRSAVGVGSGVAVGARNAQHRPAIDFTTSDEATG